MEVTKEIMELIDSRINFIDPEGKFYYELFNTAKKFIAFKDKSLIDVKWLDGILESKMCIMRSTSFDSKEKRKPVEEVYKLVDKFCTGDNSLIEEIIEAYIPLACSLVFTLKVDVPREELLAQAMYALTIAVNTYAALSPDAKKSYLVISYIRSAVFRSLRDFANAYHMIRVPTTSQRDNLKSRLELYKPPRRVSGEVLEELYSETAKPEFLLEEIITLVDLSAEESMALKMMTAGYTQANIADFFNMNLKTLEYKISLIRKRACKELLPCL